MVRIVAILALLIVSSVEGRAQNPPMINGRAWGVEMLDWCITRAKSRLFEMNKGSCKRAFVRHGNKHQNELGRSAVVELCRGNDQIAADLIRACQCHNEGVLPGVFQTWATVKTRAQSHPLCPIDSAIRLCARKGGEWLNNQCVPKRVVIEGIPARKFHVAADLRCRDRGSSAGNIGRGSLNPQLFSAESCSDAQEKMVEWVTSRDRCTEANNLWIMERWGYLNTSTCVSRR